MSMTKKEKAEFAALQVLAALRWSDIVMRDVPPPRDSSTTSGWDFNAYSAEVWRSWSGSVSHGRGNNPESRYVSGSQGSRALFSTELLALKAMRHEMCANYAMKLAVVDRRIAAEIEGAA